MFAEQPFSGNHLAVFTNASGLNGERMQRIAAETAFSETVSMCPPRTACSARPCAPTSTRRFPHASVGQRRAPRRWVRISAQVYNTMDEYERLGEAVRKRAQ